MSRPTSKIFLKLNYNYNLGIRHVRLDGKFYFAAPDLARLVLWDSERKTPSPQNAALSVTTAAGMDKNLSEELRRTFQFW